jgi:RNA polymerase sigma factor (TIGR02999 family)
MPEPGTDSARGTDALFAEVYARLKAMARRHLGAFPGAASLDATVLVHELYLRMNAQDGVVFEHPGQFFSYAAQAMRHLLLDLARSHRSLRAGGDWMQVTLTASDESLVLESAERMIALDGAIDRLAAVDERAARVIELRYFAGLTAEQAAEALGTSKRTADRDWQFALAFLRTEFDT